MQTNPLQTLGIDDIDDSENDPFQDCPVCAFVPMDDVRGIPAHHIALNVKVDVLCQFVDHLMLSDKAPESFSDIAGGGRLAALEKVPSGIRPIGVIDTLRKMIGSAFVAKVSLLLESKIGPEGNFLRCIQFACGVSKCTQKNYLAVSEYLRLHPENIVILADVKNAFNCVSLAQVLEGIKLLGPDGHPLLWYLAAFYSKNSDMSYFLDSGLRTSVTRHTGVTQGCPLGTILFCLTIWPLIKETLDSPEAEHVHYSGFADDASLGAPLDQGARAMAAIDKTLRERAGLKHKLFEVVRGSNAPDADEIIRQLVDHGLPRDAIRVIEGGVDINRSNRDEPRFNSTAGTRLLGGPIGPRSYAEKFVEELVDSIELDLERLKRFGESHPLEALRLEAACVVPRLQHALSIIPFDIASDAYKRAFSQLTNAPIHIFGISTQETTDSDVREQSTFPTRPESHP
jgi:hypothetical protein